MYAICQINGKQYKVVPDRPFEVDWQSTQSTLKIKPLLLVNDGQVTIGRPHLSDELTLAILDNRLSPKIQVAKYKPKANYRRLKGSRTMITRVVLQGR